MMNINRAVSVLAKKFVVNADVFKSVSKQTVINWAESVVASVEEEKKTGAENVYKLTRHQHAFLTGDVTYIPFNGRQLEF